MNKRDAILKDNQARREGTAARPTRLDDGYVSFRIPTKDYPVLVRKFPELDSKDHDIRLAAWHKFAQSPEAIPYLVVRTPRQVKQSPRGIIVK